MSNNQIVRIGALVGMGPNSTGIFYDKIMEYARIIYNAKYDIDFPEMVMISLPTPFYPDRDINDEEMKAKLAEGIRVLALTEADFIVIPCNIVHKYYKFMQSLTQIPILNIIDITVASLTNKSFNTKVALIATTPTIKSHLYQDKINSEKITFFHNTMLQDKVIILLMELKAFKLSNHAIALWKELITYLEIQDCTHAVIACTDISVCINSQRTNIEFVDSNDLLAKMTIQKYLQIKR